MSIQSPKGVFDIVPYGAKNLWHVSYLWQYLESTIRKVALDYGYQEMRTPMFEYTELFQRGVGDSSDIVSKEMYTFLDRSGRSLSLRPEGTAPLMRSFIENNLSSHGPLHKLYYIGPMFRYERPQAGRFRQHHQFGVETLGDASFEQDAEVIDLLLELYRRLGIKNLNLMINSLGDAECRNEFKDHLKKYLEPKLKLLSKESQERLFKNPLRILDSKSEEDKALLEGGPSILQFLKPKERDHFESLLKLLEQMKIPYTVNEKLVRGMDYYDNTLFEVVCKTSESAQNALGGGGRYNNLLSELGGPNLPGIGFGTGIERILQTMVEQSIDCPNLSNPFAYFVPLDEEQKIGCFLMATELRRLKIPVEISLKVRKINQALKMASDSNASYAIIVGEEEKKSGRAKLKNLKTREQTDIENVVSTIKNLWEASNGI